MVEQPEKRLFVTSPAGCVGERSKGHGQGFPADLIGTAEMLVKSGTADSGFLNDVGNTDFPAPMNQHQAIECVEQRPPGSRLPWVVRMSLGQMAVIVRDCRLPRRSILCKIDRTLPA